MSEMKTIWDKIYYDPERSDGPMTFVDYPNTIITRDEYDVVRREWSFLPDSQTETHEALYEMLVEAYVMKDPFLDGFIDEM